MADDGHKEYTGGCHCGAVQYTARDLGDIWFCHCIQCRMLTGHYMAACRAPKDKLQIEGAVKWTAVSENAEHGFCAECCSPVFWRNRTYPYVSLVAGCLKSTEGLGVNGHIFVAEKGDYYEIADGLPQYDQFPEDGL